MASTHTLFYLLAVLLAVTFVAAVADGTTQTAVPQYATVVRDTTTHPSPFFLRVASDGTDFDGHNVQYCNGQVQSRSDYREVPRSRRTVEYYDGGCVDANLDSPVLSFQLRQGTLFTRKFDNETDSYTDEGRIGGLKNVTNWNDGDILQFDAQSFAFASSSLEPGKTFDLPHNKWALQVTGQYQGIGVYQLVNELWNAQLSPAESPWVLGWMLCVLESGSNGEAALAWFESAQSSPVPLPDGCELIQLQTELPALGV